MRRSSKLFLSILVVAWVSPILPEAAPAADPDELAELLAASASPGTDATKVEALLDVLREAERRNAQNRETGKPLRAAIPLETEAAEPALGAAAGAGAAEVEAGKEPGDEEAAPKVRARPGCMYSGTRLIWEKLPGTCNR